MDSSILIIEDEKSVLKALRMTLEGKFRILTAQQSSEGVKLFQQEKPDLVLLDIGLPDTNGLEVLKTLKKIDPYAIVVMATAVEEVKTIVEAVKLGAYDYLVKPINSQELILTVQNALDNKHLKDQIQAIQQPSIKRYKFKFIGNNTKIKEIVDIARKVSISIDTPVLITGESGSGKSVLARTIHYNTKETPGPFVTVNAGAIAKDLVESELFGYDRGAFTGARADGRKGRFEESANGTVFLDEIGAMPLSAQTKLLGVLEDRTFYRVGGTKEIAVSSRIIAATNTDLEKAVEQGLFRQDLFYRLNVVNIEVPPLRERKDDIIPLTKHFMVDYNQKFGKRFSRILPETKSILLGYSWPGNVRELRNTIERTILLGDEESLLPVHFTRFCNLNEERGSIAEFNISKECLDYDKITKAIITKGLNQTGGNAIETAKLLNLPVHKLRYRIKKFGLKI